jgi:putative peptidoglycan lipid II flippase
MITALFFIFNNGISDTEGAAKILMSSFLVSGLAQLLICIYACQRLGYLPSIQYPKISKNIKDFFKLSFPAMGAGGITQINILVGTIIASFENKAVSYLYYADRIYQLPLALIGISIGIVLLPNLSKEIKKNNSQLIQEIQNKSLELSLILAIPASIGLIYLSNDIIMVLFERYLFDTTDTIATSRVLMIFALGLPAFVCIKILQILYFARENTSLPMRFALISVITNIILSIILFQYIGYMGIAIATTLSSWLNAILLFRKSIKENFLKISASLPKKIFKVIIVSILMIAFLFTIESYILDINYSFTGIVNFLILLFYIITGIMFYFIVCSKMAIIKIQDFFNDNKMS